MTERKSSRWVLLIGATTATAWLSSGCGGYAVTATDGQVFAQPESFSSALTASASHDLPCGGDALQVTRLDSEREYAVVGCGWRVTYRVDTPSLTSRRVALVTRSPYSGTMDGQMTSALRPAAPL